MAGPVGKALGSYLPSGDKKEREARPTYDVTFIPSESRPVNILKFQQIFPSWEAKFLATDLKNQESD